MGWNGPRYPPSTGVTRIPSREGVPPSIYPIRLSGWLHTVSKGQDEVDYYWERLSEGGDEKAQQCGWLKDKYGVSWQIVPTLLPELLSDPDSERSRGVMKALLSMKKIDIETLRRASHGQGAV
jgi:hypothetical protein